MFERVEEGKGGKGGLTVTNSGDSVISERWLLRRGCKPTGTKDAEEEEGVVLFVDGASDEEEEAGVELPLDDPESRSRIGLRGTGRVGRFPSLSDGGEESEDSRSGDEVSSSSSPLGYAAHEVCTW